METAAPARPPAEEAAEEFLVARARSGDQEAFRDLVEHQRDRAYALALRILRHPQEAEEAAQEAFVRAWRALPRFRGDARFSTWIHRIVARRALDRAAARKRRLGREVGVESAEALPAPGGGTDAAAAWSRARRLEALMATLSEAQRAVVTLYYYENRSVEEVAKALRMPEGTVKTHLSRSRAALRAGWLREERSDP
ncbi:MAG: hypothetical protein A2V63_02280 [Candidatus Eisenbacteria bacterium RBG_19FT_COMBO_70_11]|nr:MAG: hypothetical protein A2V63_02280 [Candidatus Eisenbacteria bacterium RBG_19FT_COMBO_70_11]